LNPLAAVSLEKLTVKYDEEKDVVRIWFEGGHYRTKNKELLTHIETASSKANCVL
jgi:hypothetical protein